MIRIFYLFSLVTCGLFLSFQASAQCDAGNLITNGMIATCTAADTFQVDVQNAVVPMDGGFGYSFSDALGGAGGLAGGFTLSNSNPQSTFDADVNGVLSSNGLPVLSGLWVIKSLAYTDPMNATATICSTSADSLIVDFMNFSVSATNNADGTATANVSGGTAPFDYLWDDGQTVQTAIGLPDGMIGVTVTDANDCTSEAIVNISGMLDPCTDWFAPTPPGAYTNFNSTFGGAPCDDGTGCPVNELPFELYAGEAYIADNFVMGGMYEFNICNGPGAGTWVPEFTIIAPSGAVDAFGAGDGDSCTISWTASESGPYTIVINEAGFCGGVGSPNTATDNGIPTLTCQSSMEVMCPPPGDTTCIAGTLTTIGEIGVCDDGTFDLVVEGDSIADGGGFGYFFDNALGGTGALGGSFLLSGTLQTANYDNDLNGLLTGNTLPLFSGTWVIKGAVYTDATSAQTAVNTICQFTADSLIVTFSDSPTLMIQENGDGSATATPMGGTPPYDYFWSNEQTTQTATDLELGVIGVMVTDANGCTVAGEIDVMVAVDNIEQLDRLLIAPNPTTDKFTVQFDLNTAETVNLELFDITGRNIKTIVREQTIGDNIEFDMTNQAAGVYLLRIQVGSETLTRRVMVGR